jgi:hypothetical protein
VGANGLETSYRTKFEDEDEDDYDYDEDDYETDRARLLAPAPFLSPNLLSPSALGASIIPIVGMKIYGSVR